MATILAHHLDIEDQILGEGTFGQVRKAVWSSWQWRKVVAVTVANIMTLCELEEETELLSRLDHPHVVEFYGICPDLYRGCLVIEFMENDSLLRYLQRQRIYLRDKPNIMIQLCLEVAKGLEYTDWMGFVHGDVAARSCYVDANHVVKVAGFGMGRRASHKYCLSYNSHIPIRWAAPEVLMDQCYGHDADIWAFGVLMWEVFTFGGLMPYGADIDNREAEALILRGGILVEPHRCPHGVYEVMVSCFSYSPHKRPFFAELRQSLETLQEKYDERLPSNTYHEPNCYFDPEPFCKSYYANEP